MRKLPDWQRREIAETILTALCLIIFLVVIPAIVLL